AFPLSNFSTKTLLLGDSCLLRGKVQRVLGLGGVTQTTLGSCPSVPPAPSSRAFGRSRRPGKVCQEC
uniref:Uncharacterized protein n=1 Tax=Varanus komodoensis TaxID=61221 RepID=A0A8D2LPW4_VARKO